jgi:signal transduction histidine kinase/CheY-like chemotaxis protein
MAGGHFPMRPLLIRGALLALVAVRALGQWDHPHAGQPLISTFDVPRGIESRIQGAALDGRGFLYIAGYKLHEFDGVNWTTIETPPDESPSVLETGPDGRVWAGGDGTIGYLDIGPDGATRYVSLLKKAPRRADMRIAQICHVGSKTLFLGQNDVLVWDGRKFARRVFNVDGFRLVAFRLQSQLIINHRGLNWWTYDGNDFVEQPKPEGLEAVATAFCVNRLDGSFLIGGSNGLGVLRDNRITWIAPEMKESIQSTLAAIPLKSGLVAVVSGDGISLISKEGQLVRAIDDRSGLTGGQLVSTVPDVKRGGVWLVTHRQAHYVELDSSTYAYHQSTNLAGSGVNSLTVQTDGTVFIATERGVFRSSSDPRRGLVFQTFIGRGISSVFATPQGTTLGVGGPGLREISTRLGSEIVGSPSFATSRLIRSNHYPGRYYYFERHALRAIERRGKEWSPVEIAPYSRHPAESLMRGSEDPTGRLWFWKRGKALLYDPDQGTVATYDLSDILHPNSDGDVCSVGGTPLAYSADRIAAFQSGQWSLLSTPPLGFIRQIEASSPTGVFNDLWIAMSRTATSSAVALGRIARINGQIEVKTYEAPELRDFGAVSSVARDSDGQFLWVGGPGGLLRFKIDDLRSVTTSAAPKFIRVQWRTETHARYLSPNAPLSIPFARTGSLEVIARDPTALLIGPHTLETRVDDLDTIWTLSEEGARRVSGLREGSYRLRARLVNAVGEAGPESVLSFRITPPWQRSQWAYAGYTALLGSAIGLLVRERLRKIARRNGELEALVKARTEELTRAVSAKTAFLSSMGHEIRNPINGVIGLVDSLQHKNLPVEHQQVVARLSQCASYLRSVVEDVLDYAQIEAGKISLHLRPFSVGELFADTVALFSHAMDGTILASLPPDIRDIVFLGDSDRIRQILVNYVANALKFAPGKPIVLNVERLTRGELRFSVRDRGPGISREEQGGLFQRFSRGLTAQQQAIPGTGLGLASCKAYAAAMGGSVWVESTPGEGACFFLELKLPETTRETGATIVQTIGTHAMAERSVLVIDDQEFNRFALSDLLRRLGAQTDVAESAEKARRLLVENRYDLVLLDLDLPDTTGDALAPWIREQLAAASPVIVAVSAFEIEEVKHRSRRAGMDGFIGKPVTPEKLLAAIAPLEKRFRPFRDSSSIQALAGYLSALSQRDPAAAERLRREAQAEFGVEIAALVRAREAMNLQDAAHHAHRLLSVALLVDNPSLVPAIKDLLAAIRSGDEVKFRTGLEAILRLSETDAAASEQSREPITAGRDEPRDAVL